MIENRYVPEESSRSILSEDILTACCDGNERNGVVWRELISICTFVLGKQVN